MKWLVIDAIILLPIIALINYYSNNSFLINHWQFWVFTILLVIFRQSGRIQEKEN